MIFCTSLEKRFTRVEIASRALTGGIPTGGGVARIGNDGPGADPFAGGIDEIHFAEVHHGLAVLSSGTGGLPTLFEFVDPEAG